MNDLLISLNRFGPKTSNNPTENFITEALAWILNSNKPFSIHLLNQLGIDDFKSVDSTTDLQWSTQENWAGNYPDMVCRIARQGEQREIVIFEHKTWTHLGNGQLERYKAHACNSENYSKETVRVVLITAGAHQWPTEESAKKIQDKSCHCRKCWSDVSGIITEFLNHAQTGTVGSADDVHRFLLKDFQSLLDHHGLGQIAGFRSVEIAGYDPAFMAKQLSLWRKVHSFLEPKLRSELPAIASQIDYELLQTGMQWGRIGLQLFAEWRPTVFIGTLLDLKDHAETYSNPSLGPDLTLILSFQLFAQDTIYNRSSYSRFREAFKNLSGLPSNWKPHDHFEDAHKRGVNANSYQPLYIRCPMSLAFAEADGAQLEDQARHTAELFVDVLMVLIEQTELCNLRAESVALSDAMFEAYPVCVRCKNYFVSNFKAQGVAAERRAWGKAYEPFVEVLVADGSHLGRYNIWPQWDGLVIHFIHHGHEVKEAEALGLSDALLTLNHKVVEFHGFSTKVKFSYEENYNWIKISRILDLLVEQALIG